MIRIKTENEKGRVFTTYLPSTNKWYSLFTAHSAINVHGTNKKSLEASNLFEAGQNHLELCKGIM